MSRCGAKKRKKSGGKDDGTRCPCGCYGQKVHKVPFAYKDNPWMVWKARKWKNKNDIRLIRRRGRV